MKKTCLIITCLLYQLTSFAQKPTIRWGEEFKMHKGSTDVNVIYTDNTGVYMKEKHLSLKGYYVVAASFKENASLVKLDKGMTEKYTNDFNQELRGKAFEDFYVLQDKLYIVASEYSKKEKTFTLFIAGINKNTGEMVGNWHELTNWEQEDKDDDINFKLSYNADSTKMILVSSIEGSEKNTYRIQEFDKDLKSTGPAVNITNEFEPKTFQLEDVLYTTNNKIVLVGRVYEYEEGKKKKNKFLDFSRYNIRIYGTDGKMEHEVSTSINAKWLVSTKVLQEPDQDLVLAAFYSNEKKGSEINGLLVQRIDPNTGNVISTSEKELNTSLITSLEADNGGDENESKQERKEREKLEELKDEGEGFSKYMQFRNVFYTADKGLVILAEKYHRYSVTYSSYTPGMNGRGGSYTNHTYLVFECGDLMMCKIDNARNIGWLQVLPKEQKEMISSGMSTTAAPQYNVGSYYFLDMLNMPYHAGFGALQSGNNINIFFNDDPRNKEVLQPGQRVKAINHFSSSDCFNVTLDATTGKYTRNTFFSNKDVPTSMPRLGSVIGKDMYITGSDASVFGKTKMAVARITIVD